MTGVKARFSLWSRRRTCRRRGHVWQNPPTNYHFETCVHIPCRRCDAWRTIHVASCPDALLRRVMPD